MRGDPLSARSRKRRMKNEPSQGDMYEVVPNTADSFLIQTINSFPCWLLTVCEVLLLLRGVEKGSV